MLRPCRRGSDTSFLRGTVLNNPADRYVDLREYIICILKTRRVRLEFPSPVRHLLLRAPGVMTKQEIEHDDEKSRFSRIDHDAGYDLRTGACGHGRTESAILARSDRSLRPSGGTRLQCCRSADGDTDDGAQCARLSWRTEIQRLIRTTLNGSGRLPWLDCIRRQQRNGPSLGVEAGAEV